MNLVRFIDVFSKSYDSIICITLSSHLGGQYTYTNSFFLTELVKQFYLLFI